MPVEYHLGSFPPRELQWEKLVPYIGPASAAIWEGVLDSRGSVIRRKA